LECGGATEFRNDEALQRTGLTSLSHLLSRRRISVFGLDDTMANMALQLHINVLLNWPPDVRGVAHLVVHGTSGQPATKRLHPSDWRPLEACCRPWTWWCNDATALAGLATVMMSTSAWTVVILLLYADRPVPTYTVSRPMNDIDTDTCVLLRAHAGCAFVDRYDKITTS